MSAALSRVELFDSVPALPDVLATLTSQSSDAWWCAALTDNIVRAAPEGVAWGSDCAPWAETPATRHAPAHTITPAEAVEVLATRDLWPWPVGDDASPRWWCSPPVARAPGDRYVDCFACNDLGHTADPPSLAALVAVASLGVDALRRAEGLALQLVGRAPRVVWRTMTREALRAFNEGGLRISAIGATDEACIVLTSRDSHSMAQDGSPNAWPVECPYRFPPVVAAWPVLRDLAALGLHLVALDGDRITLAVEAI